MENNSQTIEEQIAPYAEKIKQAKEKIAEQGAEPVRFADFFGTDVKIYSEYAAVMAFLEEYELIELFLKDVHDLYLEEHSNFFSKGSGTFGMDEAAISSVLNSIAEKYDVLNTRVRPEFSYFEPTPLYFITGKHARRKMKDVCKMLRFLVEHKADVNCPAGDGSTPLWNTATNGFEEIEIMQTLLELGADPNQISKDEDLEWTPLINCLRPRSDDDSDDENSWLPFDELAIKKAKLLLEHGADPNLASPALPDYPPLIIAINYGSPPDILELIELLLKKGADPNFIDDNGDTPLTLATKNDLQEIVELLKKHGAKMPDEELAERAKFFEEKRQKYFVMEEKHEKKPDANYNAIAKIIHKLIKDGDMDIPPASAEDLMYCDGLLEKLGYPELPHGYANFLKICNGYAFDGVELFGTETIKSADSTYQLRNIVLETCRFDEDYGKRLELGYPLLCIGWRNGDALVYNSETQTYQLRDHETAFVDVWEESDNFIDFFEEAVAQWSSLDLSETDEKEVENAKP